ncbi:MAG: RNHCP domain-containing protein [Clostridia bacterium]
MFVKNDNGFICKNCGQKVEKLKYTSRDHCNHCLYSMHVDITPGDRKNKCGGLLKPINIYTTGKKGQVILYKCLKCFENVRNIVATDDQKEKIYEVIEEFAKNPYV